MVAIICMGMVVHPAGFVINKMCSNDENYSRNKHPFFVGNKKLFQY